MAQPSVYERQSAQPYQHSFQMPETYAPLSTVPGMSDKKPRMSRLELMKQHYEKKRQKDVEEKLTELRAQQARTDSGKACSGGTVRAFFAERRAMEASKRGQQDPSSLPPIGIHFKKMKSIQGPVVPRSSQKKENKPIPVENVAVTHDIHSSGNRSMAKYHRKKSKGIDKQNPLPPLQRRPSNANDPKPPTPNRRYETHNTLKSEDEAVVSNHLNLNVDQESIVTEKVMAHVPHPPKNRKPSKPNKRPAKPVLVADTDDGADDEDNDGWSLYSEELQPNLSKVKALRMKRLSQQKLNVGNSKPKKATEFQKWQMQQDEERRERLENHRKKNQPADDSDTKQEKDTLSIRERELLEKIQAEQSKLSEIKKMQQELEEQEKFERESTITPQIPNGNKRKIEVEEEESFYIQKRIDETPTPVKKASPIPKEILTKKEAQRQAPEAPKKSKPKPNPQIIQQEQVSDEHEPETRDNFVSFYEQAGEGAESVAVDLSPCSICGRKFATERLSKHQVVCQKNSNKKRKKFDVRKQRVAGLEHENYVLSGKYKEEAPKVTTHLQY